MGSSSGGLPLITGAAGTPESITLSVDSLQQRQMYSQGQQSQTLSSQNPSSTNPPTWRRSPIVDITNNMPMPRNDPSIQYATQQVSNKNRAKYSGPYKCYLTKLQSILFLSNFNFRQWDIHSLSKTKEYQMFRSSKELQKRYVSL